MLLPQTIPRHCSTANSIFTAAAIPALLPATVGISASENVPTTSATAAVEPHEEIQSLQPTINPAYSPSAYRENTYCPPERGIIVPSSASEIAPRSAYSPPASQMRRNGPALGTCAAILPGARNIPAAIVLPIITASPNPTPSTRSRWP